MRAILCKPRRPDLEVLELLVTIPGARLVGASAGGALLEPIGRQVSAKLVKRLHRCGWVLGVALPLGLLDDERIGRITPRGIGELREAVR
jgi:hypothetical protein